MDLRLVLKPMQTLVLTPSLQQAITLLQYSRQELVQYVQQELLENPTLEEVASQEELLEHVWDEHADPFTQTVRVTVGTLRRKLEAVRGNGVIQTVVGRGYRFGTGGGEE